MHVSMVLVVGVLWGINTAEWNILQMLLYKNILWTLRQMDAIAVLFSMFKLMLFLHSIREILCLSSINVIWAMHSLHKSSAVFVQVIVERISYLLFVYCWPYKVSLAIKFTVVSVVQPIVVKFCVVVELCPRCVCCSFGGDTCRGLRKGLGWTIFIHLAPVFPIWPWIYWK